MERHAPDVGCIEFIAKSNDRLDKIMSCRIIPDPFPPHGSNRLTVHARQPHKSVFSNRQYPVQNTAYIKFPYPPPMYHFAQKDIYRILI